MSNEIDAHVIQATQEMLSKHIKKPLLTEKLLRKPPFRFLHDLVTNVIRETGFLKGLYSERELVSENVKDKEDKITFLNKLIEAIKTITGTDLAVKPSKVIAGFEPLNTNLLLQAIGTAITNQTDSTKYVNELKLQKDKNKENVKESKSKIAKNKEKIMKDDKKNTKTIKSVNNQNLTSKPSQSKLHIKRSSSIDSKGSTEIKSEKKKKSQIPTKQKSVDKNEVENKTKMLDPPSARNLLNKDLILETETIIDADSDTTLSRRLSNELVDNIDSIRPHFSNSDLSLKDSGFQQESDQIEEDQESTLNIFPKSNTFKNDKIENIVPKQIETEIESVGDKSISKPTVLSSRPKSSVRPISVRPSSARPGAPRLQKNDLILIKEKDILPMGKVEVIDEQSTIAIADDEETVTIEAAPEIELQATPIDLPTDKGHLVEQILQQINTADIEPTKSNLNVEWEQAGLKNRNAAIKEVDQLKGAIQELTKMVNPLGKLINYLHEDIEAMHSELDMWNNYIRQTMVEITNQKKIRNESNKPLQTKLNEIEENIMKHQQQIISTYSDIIRNEERIQDLLIK